MHFLRGSVGIPRAEANQEWPAKHRAPPRPLISLGIAKHRGVSDKGARIDSIYRGVWGIAKIDTRSVREGIPRAEANQGWLVADRAPPRPLISVGIVKRLDVRGKGPCIDFIYRGLRGGGSIWHFPQLGENSGC